MSASSLRGEEEDERRGRGGVTCLPTCLSKTRLVRDAYRYNKQESAKVAAPCVSPFTLAD